MEARKRGAGEKGSRDHEREFKYSPRLLVADASSTTADQHRHYERFFSDGEGGG